MRKKDLWFADLLFIFIALGGLFVLTGATTLRHLIDKVVAGYLLLWGLYALLSRQERAEMQTSFVLCTVAIGITLACLELLAVTRVIDYRQLFRTHQAATTLSHAGYVFDPDLLWVKQPYAHLTGTYTKGNEAAYFCLPPQAARVYDVSYDGRGFRNAADLRHAEIALVGDSYIEAPILEHPQSVAAQLARLEQQTIANFGMSGYGPQQELYVLERFVLPLRPRVVVWAFFEGNDIWDVEEYEELRTVFDTQHPRLIDFWFRSLTRNLLSSILHRKRRCPTADVAEQYKGWYLNNEGQNSAVYFMPRKQLSVQDNPRIQRAFELVAQGAQLSHEQGVQHLIVFIPIKDRVLDGLPNMTPAPALKAQPIDDLPQRLREFVSLNAPHAGFLDLTPVFRQAAAKGLLPYFEDDTHWNAEGHRLAAAAIHQYITLQMAAK
jgi:hypothetical protein